MRLVAGCVGLAVNGIFALAPQLSKGPNIVEIEGQLALAESEAPIREENKKVLRTMRK